MQKEKVEENNRQVLQWHPAFFAGIQIEFGEEAKYLEFHQEYSLGTKPMEIDILIKKEEERILQKQIGKIFRKHNIVEYKSPTDYLCIDDFYKVYAYAYFYKSDRIPVNSVKLEELTLSLVSESYPRELIRHLREDRGFQIRKVYDGIYYIIGDVLPIQIIVTSKLSSKESLWLRNLTNRMKSLNDAEELMRDYKEHKKNPLYESVMDIIVRANEDKFEEAKSMCEALEELMKEELEAKRAEGEEIGKERGKEIGKEIGKQQALNRVNMLNLKLAELNRLEDIVKAASDQVYQEQLFQEFEL